ncbi:MAG: response regulator [Treponema sp.]|nr:response regulator [Treponema sp.]
MSTEDKILIVDDDPVNLEFFQLMLSKLGYIVEEATDGLDALDKLKLFRPDLILLDNIMPRMSGWELTKNLKADLKYKDIPIIMFSALDDVNDKIAGFELGIDDYITKPFNFSEVLARIKATLNNRDKNRELFAQIAVMESRLNLSEELNRYIKIMIADFLKSIDELNSAVAPFSSGNTVLNSDALLKMVKGIMGKFRDIRGNLTALDDKIDKTLMQGEDLKKNEIGLSALETEIRKIRQKE